MPVAVLFGFQPFYRIPNNIFGVDIETCAWGIIGACIIIVWSADRVVRSEARPAAGMDSSGKWVYTCITISLYIDYRL